MPAALLESLHQGLEEMQLSVSDCMAQNLIDYVILLDRWNKVHNLTAIRSPLDMIARHLLDSLSIDPHLQGDSLLDIGAGAGLPSIPLAIVHPEISVTAVDSASKKTRFMTIAASTLGLRNLQVEHRRVETLQKELKVDMVTARAFADVDVLCRLAAPHLHSGGLLLAMVGKPPNREKMERLRRIEGYSTLEIQKLLVAGEKAERNLVILQRCQTH